jgi:recombinational DNA repair ATPase RecF
MRSVRKEAQELRGQGRIVEVRQLEEKNRKIIDIGVRLLPYQDRINYFERMKNDVQKSIRYAPEEKKRRKIEYDTRIKTIKTEMEKRYKELRGQSL